VLAVRVIPRAGRETLDGWRGGALVVRLTAPPVEDRANEALLSFLARTAGVPRRRVNLVAGARGRDKIVRFEGVDLAELLRRLGLQEPAD